jgi:hypothetical protein
MTNPQRIRGEDKQGDKLKLPKRRVRVGRSDAGEKVTHRYR